MDSLCTANQGMNEPPNFAALPSPHCALVGNGVSFKYMPFSGLMVMTPRGKTLASSIASSHENDLTMPANKHLISAFAKFCPMQLLGPCKKVMKS